MVKKVTKGNGWCLVTEDTNEKQEVISISPEKQQVKITSEKRKKGKVVTILANLVLNKTDMKALAKKLKVACGTGGSLSDEHVELQGDCSEKAKEWMLKNGWGF